MALTNGNRFRDRIEGSRMRLAVALDAYEAAVKNAVAAGWHVADQLEMPEAKATFECMERDMSTWIALVRGRGDAVFDALDGILTEMRNASPVLALKMADVAHMPKQ